MHLQEFVAVHASDWKQFRWHAQHVPPLLFCVTLNCIILSFFYEMRREGLACIFIYMPLNGKSSCRNPEENKKQRNVAKQRTPCPCRQCCSNAWKPCVSTVTRLWCITKQCWRTCCQPWQQQWGDKGNPGTAASCA